MKLANQYTLDFQSPMQNEEQETDLPKGWKIVKVKDIAENIQYGYTQSSSKDEVGPRFLRITDIQDNKVDWSSVPYCKIGDDEKKKYKLQDGDLVFARTGATVGKSFLIKGDIPDAVFASYLIRLRFPEEVSDKYVYNFFQSQFYWKQIVEGQVGIGQPNVNGTKLGELLLPLPPLPEQQAIVAKIEQLFSELDKGKEQLETALKQLKVYRQAVLKWAFEGKFTNKDVKEDALPKGWMIDTLGNYINNIEAGKSFKCDERPPTKNEIGIVKVSSVTWGEFDENESKTIYSEDQFNAKYVIRKGDFLFSRANTIELVGSCVIVRQIDKTLMLSDKILRFVFNDSISKEYVLYFLRSRKGRKEIESNSTGNQESMRNIGQQRIKQILIPICDLEEQQKVVQEIESRLSVCDKLEETITHSLKQAETLRQSILKKAFEGKLVRERKEEFTPKNKYFYQVLLIAYLIHYSRQKSILHGEMTAAKYAYLLHKIYGINTYYDFKRWYLGPYPPEIKAVVNNKKFFSVQNNRIEIVDIPKLLQYHNPYKQQVEQAIEDLTGLFSGYPEKDRSRKTELLATVCKVIEDIQSLDLPQVRTSMEEWKIDLRTTTFKSKAEKFSEAETRECLKMIMEKGWVKILIK